MTDMQNDSTSWGGVAEWYDKLLGGTDTFQKQVILPNLTRLLGLRPGTRVLDVACGQGYFAHAFAAQGAEVIGMDISPELVALAKRASRGAQFAVAPSDKLEGIAIGSADAVVIVLALQNIENVRGTFDECRRVLNRGGALHLVLNHPSFRVPKATSWAWDKNGAQYRRVDRYLTESKERIQMHPGDAPEETTISFHRPLQFYVKQLAKAGFAVTNLEEWISHKRSDSGPRAEEENRARREIPMFLYVEARPRT